MSTVNPNVATVAQIPTQQNLPWYTFQMTLTQVIYTLTMRYNTRMNRWILDVNDSQNNQILSSIPLLINRNLIGQYTTLNLPPGMIFVTDDTNQDTQATQYSFGVDHSLWYFDPEGET